MGFQNLIYCPDCDREVSIYAETCPHCGRPIKKYLEKIILMILLKVLSVRDVGFMKLIMLVIVEELTVNIVAFHLYKLNMKW